MMNDVHHEFGDENKKVKENKTYATSLLNRVKSYKSYVDKFDLYRTCAQAEKIANQIIQTPNYAEPDLDKSILLKVESALDKCDAKFKQEMESYIQIDSKLYSTKHLVWLEDYDKIHEIVEKGAAHNLFSASQLSALYADAVNRKKEDLTQLKSGYSDKILSYFRTDIESITNSCLNSQELELLRIKFDAKKAKDRKHLYWIIAKIVACFIAIILFLVYWPVSGIILGIMIVIGLIIFFLYMKYN